MRVPSMYAADVVVLWRVFEHCNLSCDFCGYSSRLVRPRLVADVRQMLAFGQTLGEFARSDGRQVLVSWLGGEPLLWSELPELSRQFRRRFGVQLSVTTNGLPLERAEVRAALVAEYAQVTISVDGVGEVHDRCRNSPGLFDRIRRQVITLRQEAEAAHSTLRLRVNTILMRENVAEFEALCREVADWGVRELTFNQLGGNDRPEFYPDNRLRPDQVDRFARDLPALRNRLSSLGLEIHGSERYLERIASTSRGRPIPVDDCRPGTWFLFIDEQGRAAPCSFTTNAYGVSLDEIRSRADLAALPGVFAERRLQRVAACDDCHSTQVFDKFALGACEPERGVQPIPKSF